MTAAEPLARYSAVWKARFASGSPTTELHHVRGHDLRAALGERPGVRMLVIAGASHKGYLEAYLNQMHDVRLVDAEIMIK